MPHSKVKEPEPKYDIATIVVFNDPTRVEDGKAPDELLLIKNRALEGDGGKTPYQWYYRGHILQMKESKSPDLPLIPYYSSSINRVSEDNLKPLEEIL